MSLKARYQEAFCVGATVNSRTIHTHGSLVAREFGSITCENEMKFGVVAPDGQHYDFTRPDAITAFAVANGLPMRMHTLLWHRQVPQAIFQNATRESLLGCLQGHIQTMARRYGEHVFACDVVNEVIADSAEKVCAGGLYRQSPWVEIIGEDFVDQAFTMAKAAMPQVKLFYNDYNECDRDKSRRICRLIQGMQTRGIPVEGLGLQCHWSVYGPSMDNLRHALDLYSRLGVELHVTEMDVSLYREAQSPVLACPTPELLERQAEVYGQAFEVFKQYSGLLTHVTTWGVADDATWLDNFPVRGRKDWPLLFDESHQPKPAWHRLMAP